MFLQHFRNNNQHFNISKNKQHQTKHKRATHKTNNVKHNNEMNRTRMKRKMKQVMKTYQKFMTEKRGDTVVFTFGRFNPPTVGHKKLITAVESIAKTKGADFFIYPSHSQDSKKNPLNQTQKIKKLNGV